jgi:purine catabolism regulator
MLTMPPLTPYSPLTVADALAEPVMSDARLVAGARGLSRRVRTVGVLDVEDLDGVRSDEFVLSSAYPLLDLDLLKLVARLEDASISGLGVKTEGYWERMPAELSAACESVDLPLLQLPPGPFDELVNPLLGTIADRQAEGLRRSAELHAALTRAVLAEVDLGAVAMTVSRALGRATAIIDEHGDILADAGSDVNWVTKELGARAAALSDVEPVRSGGRDCLVAPISALSRHYGAICVLGVAADDAFVRSAVAEAAAVSGTLLVGHRRVEAVHRRFERELLDDLVDGRLTDPERTMGRARRIGWPHRRPYVVVVAGRRRQAAGPLEPALEVGLGEDTLATFTRALRGLPFQARVFLRRPGLCVVVHLEEGSEARAAGEATVDRLMNASGAPWVADHLVAGVGRPRTTLPDLAEGFREAALTVLTSPRIRNGSARVEHFVQLGPARVAAQVADRPALDAMAAAALGPLADRELPGRDELLETLAVLLDHNMSIAETAGELFFHYNTVRHRLGRLRELLGDRLATPEGRTSLALAVAALRVARAEDGVLSPGRLAVAAA